MNSHILIEGYLLVGAAERVKVGRREGCCASARPTANARAFNDFARLAEVESFVTMSASGHHTERIRDRYSTVQAVEQREGIGRPFRLVEGGAGAPSQSGGAPRAAGGAPKEKVPATSSDSL
jgi:hypothetical protein